MAKLLTSALFRDNDRLQNCAVSDRWHVKKGEKGDHVKLIQMYYLKSGEALNYFMDAYETFEMRKPAMEVYVVEARFGIFGEYTEEIGYYFKENCGFLDEPKVPKNGTVGIRTIKLMDRRARGYSTPTTERKLALAALSPHELKAEVMRGFA